MFRRFPETAVRWLHDPMTRRLQPLVAWHLCAGLLAVALPTVLVPLPVRADDDETIQIADVKHEGPVDFEKEILPILRRNCLACHNSTEAESDLVLESPQVILKGGSIGPAVVAGKSDESLLLQLAARQMEPYMPPDDNDRQAKKLTPQELGLIKLWIDQGAKGEVRGIAGVPDWQPLPPGVHPIFAVAASEDGQFAAASRGNQVFVFHLPSKRELGRLTDPQLLTSGIYDKPGVAMLDLVQSLKFSPDGEMLAVGGFRTVKLFRRPRNLQLAKYQGIESEPRAIAVSPDGKWLALGEESGKIRLFDPATQALVRTLEGHAAGVTGLAFTPDSSLLVSGSADKTFRVWKAADGQLVCSPVETPAPIRAVAFVSQGKQLATAHEDNVIRLWEQPPATAETTAEAAEEKPAPPQPVKELQGHGGPVTTIVAANAEGSQLLSGSQDGSVRLWDLASGNTVRNMSHGGPVESVAVRPDGQRFASASSNNTAKLWNAGDGKPLAELRGDFRTGIRVGQYEQAVRLAQRRIDNANADLKAANDRKAAEEKNATANNEAKKKAEEELAKKVEAAKKPVADKQEADKALVDAMTAQTKAEEEKKAAEENAPKAAEALKVAQEKQQAAAKAATEAADAAAKAAEQLKQAKAAADAEPDNKEKAEALKAAEKAAQEAEAASKAAAEAKQKADTALAEAEAAKKAADERLKTATEALAKAQNDVKQADAKVKQLAGPAQKATDEQTAAERALEAAKRAADRAAEAVQKASDAIPPAEAAVKDEQERQKLTAEQLEQAKKFVGESEKPIRAIAFSPDGSMLASAGDDELVHTWDAETVVPLDTYSGSGAPVSAIAFTPENRLITAAKNQSAAAWELQPGWQLERVIGSADAPEQLVDRVTALDFSSDGKLLATGSGEPSRSGEIKLWNVADGSLVRELKEPHSDTIFALEFSPDDQQIASCAADRFMKVFNTSDGSLVRSFEGHTHHVLGVSWRADGRLLATAGADKVVKVWDARTGDQARTIQGFEKEVTAIGFLAEGDQVVASEGGKAVRIKNAANGGNGPTLGGAGDYMYCVAASGDGKTIVAGGQDSVVRIWDDKGTVIATFDPPAQPAQTAKAEGK